LSIQEQRYLQLKREISERLQRVCSHLSRQDFEERVTKIANTKFESERRFYGDSGFSSGNDNYQRG
jgi:hypothetical protein